MPKTKPAVVRMVPAEQTLEAVKEALRSTYPLTGDTLDVLIDGLLASQIDVEIRVGVTDTRKKRGRAKLFVGFNKRLV